MKKHSLLYNLAHIVIGTFILSISITWFIIPNNILTGGMAGIAVALHNILPFSEEVTITILTYFFLLLDILFLGKEFVLKTIVSSLLLPVFIWVTTLFFDGFVLNNLLIASLFAGLIAGAGLGIVYRCGASTGGVDTISFLLNKYLKVPLDKGIPSVDTLILLLGLMTVGLENVLIGLISVFSTAYALNKTLTFGMHSGKNVLIISDNYSEIETVIKDEFDRGWTYIEAQRGYSGQHKPILMVVVTQKEYPLLQERCKQIDPKAFIIVQDVHEVHGEGFSYRYR